MINIQQFRLSDLLSAFKKERSLISDKILPELGHKFVKIEELLKLENTSISSNNLPNQADRSEPTSNLALTSDDDSLETEEDDDDDINQSLLELITDIDFDQPTKNPQVKFSWLDLKFDPLINKVGLDLAVLSTVTSNFPTSSSFLLPSEPQEIVIDAYATTDGQELLGDLTALGLKHGAVFGNTVSGLMSMDAIEAMAKLDSLKFARPTLHFTNVGTTTTQADVAMRSDIARTSFELDGTGVTVGILSDSYDNLGGAAADILTGDLPGTDNPLGNNIPVNVLQDIPENNPIFPGIDEGRAMAQLIHDVAPGAELAFHTALLGQANFANGIIELAEAGSDVIVDDIGYSNEPMFQDGIIAQAVDQVVADGVAYFASAGNSSRNSYESEFNNSGQLDPLFGGQFHDFDPGAGVDIFQSLTIPVGSTIILSFQWDSPFFSVSGGAGSPNDLDILLFDETGTNLITGGFTDNLGQDAVETLGFTNDGSFGTDQFNLAISQFAGAEAGFIKYVGFGSSDFIVNEYDTQSSTTYGHSNANGAESVGAAFYKNTPEFGINPARLQPFSSVGGTPILFDTAGNRLSTPEIREKINIVAPDGGNTTFFPLAPDNPRDREEDGFPNFFGTSAAAPHAAAVAALMLEAAPGTSPETIYQTLESTALDMDDPFTPGFDVGFDPATGYGLIQADRAIEALLDTSVSVQPQPVPEPNDTINQAVSTTIGSQPAIFQGRIGDNPNIFAFQDIDLFEFHLETGERVTLDIDTGIRSGLNSVLRVFDSEGNELAVSDNDPAPDESFSADSYISFEANETGFYYAGVSGLGNSNYDPFTEGSGEGFVQGDYQLTIAVPPNNLVNGGFETGNFDEWERLGNVTIQTGNFGIEPTQGSRQAFLTNGSNAVNNLDLEVFVGLQPGELDTFNNGFTVQGSAIKRTVEVAAGDTLSFDWNFITNESTPDTIFNDFAFVSITPGTAWEIADTGSDFVDSETSFQSETGYSSFSYTFTSSGTFTVAVGVVDVVDDGIDSGLLVDNFSING
ncbi:MAG: S8 family serine peptidase [Xenococcaceae cyanobacterium MO_167.B52]|nr:S8 family serine peptidase [Xenococcaceae cyanobacterium MO_167.B52]